MRIHTDIYDDRHGDSRRESGGGRRGPPSREQGRGRDRPPVERGRRHEGPAGAGTPHEHHRSPDRGRHHTATPKQNDAQLTNLSFDERMNYYKEKYAGEGGPAAGGEGQRGGNRPGQRPAGPQRPAGSQGPRAPRPARPKHTGQGPAPQSAGISGNEPSVRAPHGGNRSRKDHPAKGRASGQESAKQQTSPGKSEPAAAPKKGLLGRLLGVFKKKPD
jgi:hypothetical protein